MPPLTPSVTLASRVGSQSLHLFEAMGIGTAWLNEPVEDWDQTLAACRFQMLVPRE